MTPDLSTTWVDEEPLPQGRVMGNWIFIPDGRLVLLNGIGSGTAGYGNTSWAVGQSFGDVPIHSLVSSSIAPYQQLISIISHAGLITSITTSLSDLGSRLLSRKVLSIGCIILRLLFCQTDRFSPLDRIPILIISRLELPATSILLNTGKF